MMNFERTGDTVVSWIWGLATISTAIYLLGGGSSISAPLRVPVPPRSRERASGDPAARGVLDAAALARPATVVRHRRDVLDADDLESRGGERPDGGFAPRTRALDVDVDLLEAVLLRAARGGLGGELRGERGGLPGALEPDVAGARPRQGIPLAVGDRDDRVVE